MLKNMAKTMAFLAGLGLAGAASAGDQWWDDDHDSRYRASERGYYGDDDSSDDDYRERRYRQRYQARYASGHTSADYVYADVVAVEPIYRYVRVRQPQRECWDEEVYDTHRYRDHGTAGATIVGGVIGGAIGRQFGDGKGRDAMTVVGTLVGSAVAHDQAVRRQYYDDYDRPQARTVQRCATRVQSYEDRRIDGYYVTYRYGGREYTTRTASEPGRRVRVRVAVTPVGYPRY